MSIPSAMAYVSSMSKKPRSFLNIKKIYNSYVLCSLFNNNSNYYHYYFSASLQLLALSCSLDGRTSGQSACAPGDSPPVCAAGCPAAGLSLPYPLWCEWLCLASMGIQDWSMLPPGSTSYIVQPLHLDPKLWWLRVPSEAPCSLTGAVL